MRRNVAQRLRPPIPERIQRNVHDDAVRIRIVSVILPEHQHRRAVICRIFRAQPRHRVRTQRDIPPGCRFRLCPKGMVALVAEFREQVIEVRQMIRRVADFHPRHELDIVIFRIPHRLTALDHLRLMHAVAQNILRPVPICENPLAVAPACRSHQQRHREILFSIRRRAFRIVLAVQLHRPCEVSLMHARR